MLSKNRGMQPSAAAERAATLTQRVRMESTMSPRRRRKQPDWYGKPTPSNAIPSDSGLDVEDTGTAESESDTSEDSNVSDQGPWADSSDDEQTQEPPGPRSKRRSTAAATAIQPTNKKAKVAQPEAPQTASSRQGRWRKGGCYTSRVISLPDGGKAVETEIASFVSCNFIKLPAAFSSECFPNPPYVVHLKVTVDDELADPGAATGQVRQYSLGNGGTQHRLCYRKGLWNSYSGHIITKLSTNSSSNELTFHLTSPAAQQAGTTAEAAAIAAAAAAGQTYWFDHEGTGRILESCARVVFPVPLLQKLFGPGLPIRAPGSNSDTSMKVVVSIYKDSELASRTNQPLLNRPTDRSKMIRVPLAVREQLAGLKLVRLRAAKPNLLEVYFSSEGAQEPAAAAAAHVPPSHPSQPAAAPVPPSAHPNQPAAAPSDNQQAGPTAAELAGSRLHMPLATAALAEQHALLPAATTSAPAASDGALPTLGNAAAAAAFRRSAALVICAGDSAAVAIGILGNTSSMHSIQLAAAAPKAAAAAGVPESSSSARVIGAEGAAAATRPGTLAAATTAAEQTLTQLQRHVRFDLPAANCGILAASSKEAGTGFGSHDRPELNTNMAAAKSHVDAAGQQTPPESAPKGCAESYSAAARRASSDLVQGSVGRLSTEHTEKMVLQALREQQQLGIQQPTGTTAATDVVDLTLGSDEEAEDLPLSSLPQQAAPASSQQLTGQLGNIKPNNVVANQCSTHQVPAPWERPAAAAAAQTVPAAAPSSRRGATSAVKTVEAALTAAQRTMEPGGTAAATTTGAATQTPGMPPAAAATTPAAPAAPATLGLKLEAHTAVPNLARSMAGQTATAANDRTGAAGLPAGFNLEPFKSVPLAFKQLVRLLEVLAAPNQLMQQLQTAAQAMRRAKGTDGWPERREILEMHYSIVQAYVRRGTADLALNSVGVLLEEALQ